MNKIINDWSAKTLEECCDILDNKRVPINSEEREKRPGEIPYYGANGLQGYIDGFIFDEPLILIAEDGGQFNEFATRPIAYRIEGKSWVNNHAHVLRAKKEYNQNAIFYALEHKDIQPYIVGGTRSKLNQSALRKIPILIPNNKNEQNKIAEILETVDRSISQTEALIAKQERIKTGLMQDLLTKGIDEHGNIRSEETHEFKESLLGRIPVEWGVTSLSNYVGFIKSGLSRRILEIDIGVPVITSTNIQRGQLDTTQLSYWYKKDPQGAKTESFVLDDGDILLNFINSFEQIGKVCIFREFGRETIYTTNIFRIKANQQTDYKFLFFLIESRIVQQEIKLITKPAVNQASFTKTDFIRIMVPQIPFSEQQRIANYLDAYNKQQRNTELCLFKYKRIKSSLLQDLLTGKKRVTTLLEEFEVIN